MVKIVTFLQFWACPGLMKNEPSELNPISLQKLCITNRVHKEARKVIISIKNFYLNTGWSEGTFFNYCRVLLQQQQPSSSVEENFHNEQQQEEGEEGDDEDEDGGDCNGFLNWRARCAKDRILFEPLCVLSSKSVWIRERERVRENMSNRERVSECGWQKVWERREIESAQKRDSRMIYQREK